MISYCLLPYQKLNPPVYGSVILTFTANSLFEVKRWVLSWGSGAEVLEPALLIKQIRVDIHGLLECYKKM